MKYTKYKMKKQKILKLQVRLLLNFKTKYNNYKKKKISTYRNSGNKISFTMNKQILYNKKNNNYTS